MNKGFILGFFAALILVGVVCAAFLLGRGSVKKENTSPSSNTISTDTVSDETPEDKSNDNAASNEVSDGNVANTVLPDGIRINAGETWDEGDTKCYKYQIYIKNTTNERKEGWTVKIQVPSDCVLGEFWDGDLKIENGTIIATPKDYNKILENDAEVSFGVILKTKENYNMESVNIDLYL